MRAFIARAYVDSYVFDDALLVNVIIYYGPKVIDMVALDFSTRLKPHRLPTNPIELQRSTLFESTDETSLVSRVAELSEHLTEVTSSDPEVVTTDLAFEIQRPLGVLRLYGS